MYNQWFNQLILRIAMRGCKMVEVSPDTMDFFPATENLYLNKQNQMGVELNAYIRISGIEVTDYDSFVRMMRALKALARRYGYKDIRYMDTLTDDVLDMFLKFGFSERIVSGDYWNHYLYLKI